MLSRKSSALAVLATAVLAVSGCSDSDGDVSTPTPAPATTSAPAPTTDITTQVVEVTETEFSIKLDTTEVKSGPTTFRVSNKGKFFHNFFIEGTGVNKVGTITLRPGESDNLTVNLQPGDYEIWCQVDSHKAKGMDLDFTVT